MKLASHDSFTYLKTTFWGWFIKWMAKCQDLSIEEQYEYGVRCFDFRVWFDKSGVIQVRHGLVRFKLSPEDLTEILKYLDEKGDVWCRVILEENNVLKHKSYASRNDEYFKSYCKYLEDAYTNIKFFCGTRRYDKEVLYEFKTAYPNMYEYNRSGIWPWASAKLHNKEDYANHTNEDQWAMFDFVEIC